MTNNALKTPDATAISAAFKQQDKALTILPELKDFLDILSADERKGLEADLIASKGARDPLIVWKEKQVIVDGHNRYEICKLHNLPFKTEEMSFPDVEAVKQWMLKNQLNRRNLTPTRISYFRGMLYNQMKQDPNAARTDAGGKSTAAKLGEQFGVDEKTIRRDGNVAAGIDAVGKANQLQSVKDKLELLKSKSVKGDGFTKGELEEIGKVKDPEVQVAAVKELEKIKADETKTQAVVKKQVEALKQAAKPRQQIAQKVEKEKPYSVAFVKPAFESSSFNVTTEVKPPLAENAVCYMSVADEELAKAFLLLNRWGFKYEGSIVFAMDEKYEGTFANVNHVFMIVATKGIASMSGKAVSSIMPKSSNPDDAMIKVIEGYHPKDKRLDMRRERTAKGWEKLA